MSIDRLHRPLYEPSEAARMLRLTPSRVRRWLFGYEFPVGADKHMRKQRPVVLRGASERRMASFLDVIDLLGAKSFLDEGISLQKVRAAFDEAANELQADHPFARGRFFTSGGDIFLELNQRGSLLHLLTRGQLAIAEIIRQCGRQVEFDPSTDLPLRWFPLGKEQPVVIDPRVSFGAPVVTGKAVKTSNIFDFFRAERGRVSTVSSWFGLTPKEVEAAVTYEEARETRAAA